MQQIDSKCYKKVFGLLMIRAKLFGNKVNCLQTENKSTI